MNGIYVMDQMKDIEGIDILLSNGFFHGLVIDDYGPGQERRYKFSCCEMDIDLYFYCAKISVELLYP